MATARTRGSFVPSAKPRSDVYTGLLILALLAQAAGIFFLCMDYKDYPKKRPDVPVPKVGSFQPGPAPPVTRPPAGGPGAPPPAPPAGGMMGGNPPGTP